MLHGKSCILVVDDDYRMRKAICDILKRNNFEILEADNGDAALSFFYEQSSQIDLILLDVMMPKTDGFSVLNELRQQHQTPVILLTARDQEADQVSGLSKGADDYIIKPFSSVILVARIETVLRRSSIRGSLLQVGKLLIDPQKRSVTLCGEFLELTAKEYDLLLYFISKRGVSLSREQILSAVWDFRYLGDGRTIDTHVKQLRAKLTPQCPYIKTVFGIGYLFEVSE